MSWVIDKADDVVEGVGDYIIDPITGEDKREAAKEATAATRSGLREAEQHGLTANIHSREALLAALTGQRSELMRAYDVGRGHLEGARDAGRRYLREGSDAAKAYLEGAKEYFEPRRELSTGAMSQLGRLYGFEGPEAREVAMTDFEMSPGYSFRKSEGEKAIRRLANARGKLGSGQMYKQLLTHGQGLASSEYGSYFDRLSQLARFDPSSELAGINKHLAMYESELAPQLAQYESDLGRQLALYETDLGSQLARVRGGEGDVRSSAFLTEGAIKGGTATGEADAIAQLALVPRGSLSTTISNVTGLAQDIGSAVSSLRGAGVPLPYLGG